MGSDLPLCLRIGVPPQDHIMSEPLVTEELCFPRVTQSAYVVSRESTAPPVDTSETMVDNAKPLTRKALEAATAGGNVRDILTALNRSPLVKKWLSTLPAQIVQSPLSALTSLDDAPLRSDSLVESTESMQSTASSAHPILRPAPIHGVPVLRKPVPHRAHSIRAEVCWTSSLNDAEPERPPILRAVTGPQFEDFLSRDMFFASHEHDNEGLQHHRARGASALAAHGLKNFGKQAAKQVTKVAERVDHVVTEMTASRHGHA